ncbi:MAG: hypothetical protein WKF84_00955 [Pyrinomonadaceae bacterium]
MLYFLNSLTIESVGFELSAEDMLLSSLEIVRPFSLWATFGLAEGHCSSTAEAAHTLFLTCRDGYCSSDGVAYNLSEEV